MAFTFYKVSNHGVGHPVVARLSLQTIELLKFGGLSKQQEGKVAELYMGTLQPRLLKCHDIFDRLTKALKESVDRIKPRTDGSMRELPYVAELRGEVEAFLYEVKNYLRDLLGLFQTCVDCELKNASDLYNAKGEGDSAVVKWANEKYEADHRLSNLLRTEQPWVEQVIRARNAVDHPGGKSGTLVIHNVRACAEGWVPPCWSRDGQPESDILTDMSTLMHNMLTLAEDLLIECIVHTTPHPAITFYEVPEAERDPKSPIRIRVGLKPWVAAAIDEDNAKRRSEQSDDNI